MVSHDTGSVFYWFAAGAGLLVLFGVSVGQVLVCGSPGILVFDLVNN